MAAGFERLRERKTARQKLSILIYGVHLYKLHNAINTKAMALMLFSVNCKSSSGRSRFINYFILRLFSAVRKKRSSFIKRNLENFRKQHSQNTSLIASFNQSTTASFAESSKQLVMWFLLLLPLKPYTSLYTLIVYDAARYKLIYLFITYN